MIHVKDHPLSYTPRGREGLPVSVPIFRNEIEQIKGAGAWNIYNRPERPAKLSSDPWPSWVTPTSASPSICDGE